ncbi:Hsp20/alpha crystallin family protein [Coraliomargarita sp. W4R53]
MNDEKTTCYLGWGNVLLGVLVIIVCWQAWLLYRLSETTVASERALAPPALTSESPGILPDDAFINAPDLFLPDPLIATSRDPWADMQRMRGQIDRLFSETLGAVPNEGRFADLFDSGLLMNPKVDVSESKGAYEVTVDLPGVDDSQINVTLEDQTLTINATTRKESEQEEDNHGTKVLRRERQEGQFQRSILFEHPVVSKEMTQKYEDGVLRIHVPKAGGER